jgi:hypothetical protein
MFTTQIPIEVEVELEVVKPHFEVNTEARMVDIINMKVKLMEVDEETLEEEEVGSCGGRGGSHRSQQPNSDSNYYYYGKPGHMAKNCYQREHDAQNGKLQQGNYASTNNQDDEQLFVIQHMANSMIGGVSDNNVWYVDSRASNHMTSHGEWFRDTKDLKTPGFVETGDDTTHPITQISKVPLFMQDGQTKYLKDVLHVPTITKNLVSVGQIVEQGLQVTFNPNGCFVEDMKNQGKLITKGERNGRMFTLDVNMPEVNSMLFTHGKGGDGQNGPNHEGIHFQRFTCSMCGGNYNHHAKDGNDSRQG